LAADGTPGDDATVNKENVFNALTDNGTKNIFEWNGGDLYINATYINSGILKAVDSNGKTTFSANVANGVVELGGWVANNSSLKTTSYGLGTNNSFHMYSTPVSASGLFGSSGSKEWMLGIGQHFGVTSDGSVYAKAGQIGGWTINQDRLASTIYAKVSGGSEIEATSAEATIRYSTGLRKMWFHDSTQDLAEIFYVKKETRTKNANGSFSSWTSS
jgi:hypothetical protein